MWKRKDKSKEEDKPRRQNSDASNGSTHRHSSTSTSTSSKRSSRKDSSSTSAAAAAGRTSSNGGAGAFSVQSSTATFRVQIPPNIKPGEEFQVYAGSRVVRVKAPRDCRPGQALQITVPVDPNIDNREKEKANMQDAVPDSENVTKIPNQKLSPGEMPAYMVRIPEGVRPGTQFPVTIGGQQLMVTCPNMARPGNSVRITPPPPSNDESKPSSKRMQRIVNPNKENEKTQMFEVVVPRGVHPGQPFALLAGGVRVLVTCPANATPGQKIRFHLPKALILKDTAKSKLQEIKLSYDKDGWTRTIRATDMKFQWTRFDHQGGVDTRTRFDTDRSAYVRKLEFLDDSARMRQGKVSLVTPDNGVVDSNIKGNNGEELVSYSDIASAQMKSYEEKIQWFQDTCAQLCVEWNEGHMRMNVRRDYLLSDSMAAVMSLSAKDLRKVWRFEFIGEAGIDAGGLAREWFELVTEECFDPDMGLWQPCATNQMCLQINPASEISCPEDHLYYFRFIGRIMGKAMFDRQLVKGHMVKNLYKHILGWPIMFNDLKDVDEEYYNSLKGLKDMGADVECVGVDFTVTEETLGVRTTVELVPDGANIDVTEENLPEYIEACLKYRMLGRCEKQINELLLGFFDVIPEPLLTIFDFQELELLMCGLPTIDMQDWMDNTEYSGEFDREGPNHECCKWFWEVVSEYEDEMKARLLQFVTGESICAFWHVILMFYYLVYCHPCSCPQRHREFQREGLVPFKEMTEMSENSPSTVLPWRLVSIQDRSKPTCISFALCTFGYSTVLFNFTFRYFQHLVQPY